MTLRVESFHYQKEESLEIEIFCPIIILLDVPLLIEMDLWTSVLPTVLSFFMMTSDDSTCFIGRFHYTNITYRKIYDYSSLDPSKIHIYIVLAHAILHDWTRSYQ